MAWMKKKHWSDGRRPYEARHRNALPQIPRYAAPTRTHHDELDIVLLYVRRDDSSESTGVNIHLDLNASISQRATSRAQLRFSHGGCDRALESHMTRKRIEADVSGHRQLRQFWTGAPRRRMSAEFASIQPRRWIRISRILLWTSDCTPALPMPEE